MMGRKFGLMRIKNKQKPTIEGGLFLGLFGQAYLTIMQVRI